MIGRHLCKRCKNFLSGGIDADEWKCKAFPNGIPYEVYSRMDPWKPPKDCNNGIGFEPKEDEDE